MKAMTQFEFHTHAIRVLPTDDGAGFVAVAADVARALEYGSAKDMLRCVDDEDKGWADLPALGGTQRMRTINESGVYTATIRSHKPTAKPFRRWVTAEVLPSIRRTGAYVHPAASDEAAAPALPLRAELTPAQYKAELAALEALQARLAGAKIVISPEEYDDLTAQRLQVGKKVHLVRDLVGLLESHGIPRDVAKELTGHDSRAIRQAVYNYRKLDH